MNIHKIVAWLTVVVTAGIMVLLKKLHLGVTHYNLFLTILLVWSLVVIVVFRVLSDIERSDSG